MRCTGRTDEKEFDMCPRIETIQVAAPSGDGGVVALVLWQLVGEAS